MAENIIRIHRPDLTPEEHAKRMKQIKEAAERLVLAAMKAKWEGGTTK